MATTIQIGSDTVKVTAEPKSVPIDVEKAITSPNFENWCKRIAADGKFKVKEILLQSLDMFGPKVGFLKFKADVTVDSKPVPGIVFMRGGAVAILVVLKCKEKRYTVVVRQPRIPVGKDNLPEIPAGMLDGEGNFAGVAATELKEETGIHIKEKDLINMSKLAWRDQYPGMFPSCGGSDEFNPLFLYRQEMSEEEIQFLQGKFTGVAEEGEMIKLEIIEFDDLWKVSPDSKALCAIYLHDQLVNAKEIEPF
jgi:ADP-sugar diphosphatase